MNVPEQGRGDGKGGDPGGRPAAEEREDHQHRERHGKPECVGRGAGRILDEIGLRHGRHRVNILIFPLQPLHHGIHLADEIDGIGIGLLHHLQCHGTRAVETGNRLRQRAVYRLAAELRHGDGIHPKRYDPQHAGHLLDRRQEGAQGRSHELCRGAELAHQRIGHDR